VLVESNIRKRPTLSNISVRRRAEKALRESKEHLEDAIESISDAFVLYDANGKLVLCNQKHRDFFPHLADIYRPGISREEIMRHHAAAAHEKDPTFDVEGYLDERLKLIKTPRLDKEGRLINGRWVAIRERSVAGGGIVSIRTDITERKKSEESFTRLFKQNELILASTGDGIYGVDWEGRITFANPAMMQMIGWEAEELIGKSQHDILHHTKPDGSSYRREDCPIYAAFNEGITHRVDNEVLWRKNGSSFPVEYVSTPIEADGRIIGAVVAVRDITDRILAEQKIKHLASHDALTNLPNRTMFMDRVEQGLARARRDNTMVALMFIDLDGFKPVNDTFGHDSGDETLRQVAERIVSCLRGTDTVARIGGDEFTVIMTDFSNPTAVSKMAKKILDAVSEPFHIGDDEVNIGASIGVALYPLHGQEPDDLLKAADNAMYASKDMGKGTYQFAAALVSALDRFGT